MSVYDSGGTWLSYFRLAWCMALHTYTSVNVKEVP